MQHVKVADKSLMVGDAVADLLLEYAALMGRISSADTVRVRAIGADGDEVVAGLLLNEGTMMVTETSHSSQPEPDNGEAEQYVRERLARFDVDATDPFGSFDDVPTERSG